MSEKELLKGCCKYITEIIQPSLVLHYLDFFEPKEVELIKAKEEKEGPTHASALLLDLIQNVDSLGWFQMFLDGLSKAGYPTLSKSIDMEDFTELDKSRLYKQMVRKLRPTLEPGARPMAILPHLSECLLQPQEEEVRQVTESKGDHAGMGRLLDFILRSDNPQWYKILQDALSAAGYVNLALGDQEDADMESGTEEIEMTYSQEAEMEDLHTNLDSHAEPRQKVVRYDSQISSRLTELRAYQEELALPALESRNTIICAPTGSGKTIIAVEICWQHLRQGTEESKRKVAFLANTIPLCQQQMERFMKYFQNTDFEVIGCFGDSASNLAVKVAVEGYDIIVMTPMILQLNLENGTIPSLSTFTLIFFDECHNTSKKHSYNSIMGMYMDIRLEGPPSTALPQIVGMTASVGVGKSKNVDGALEHIYQLCASLDTHTLSTVTKHLNELRKFVFVPSKDIRLVKRRSVDPFMDVVLGLMAHVESIAKKTYNIESLSKVPMSTRGSQAYEQWVVTVQRQCKVLKLVDHDEEEEMKICRKLVACSEHLRKYNDSLIISEDARAIDAINYLQKYFDNLDPTRFDETDQKLFSVFEERSKELLRIASSSGRENPKLQELQSVLDEQYHYNSETKTILFVKTRALAEAIEQWMLETPALAHLKPKVLIGRRRTENTAGMTLSTQKDALSAFESEGGSKLLIATSVADEGIDIAQCNLVLLYDYVGNVIKMVQTRGRGRAMDSRCILITSSRENAEKEQINMLQEKVMYDAIQTVQNIETDVFLAKVRNIQKRQKKQRDLERRMAPGKKKEETPFLLQCGKCRQHACKTDEIRVIQNNHRVVISKAFLSLCNIQPHPKPQVCDVLEKKSKIFCGSCNRDWGILASCMGLDNLPVLKVSGFTFVNLRTGQRKSVMKWQDFPGLIKDFDFELDVLDQDSSEGAWPSRLS
ncbi:antiviral innate immune response receptor RIG-I-like [Acipenser oxyrinchus oxyrinchus]|uniref:RNA helicase n=1 Tax=Acipenser oxyrinchus oxyrinchus TaxID=40147 RepID=A0AAD8GHI0_ACIOX|nr:antiviral innate immune response receptor RIG-I-like [Acipenser oxyrinchus oxyrinchus]